MVVSGIAWLLVFFVMWAGFEVFDIAAIDWSELPFIAKWLFHAGLLVSCVGGWMLLTALLKRIFKDWRE